MRAEICRGISTDGSDAGIWVADNAGKTTYANEHLAHILGTELDVIYERTVPSFFTGWDGALVAENLRRRAEVGPEAYELAYQRPDGSHRILRCDARPHRHGTTLQAMATLVDITDERRAHREALPPQQSHRPLRADRLLLRRHLSNALARDGLELHYEPIINPQSGLVTGFKSHIRWPNPQWASLDSRDLSTIADEIDLGGELELWTLRRVRRELEPLGRISATDPVVAVDVAARRLSEPGFARAVLSALGQLPPSTILLEVNEWSALHPQQKALQTSQHLVAQGIELVLDNFGSCGSCLGCLATLPISRVKLHPSLLGDIQHDPDAVAFLSAVLDLARARHLTAVAQGVETAEQSSIVRRLGFPAAQGPLWSRAVSVDRLESVMADLRRRSSRRPTVRPGRRPSWTREVSAEHGLQVMLRLLGTGASMASIAAALNSNGFRTPAGTRWHQSSVANTLRHIPSGAGSTDRPDSSRNRG